MPRFRKLKLSRHQVWLLRLLLGGARLKFVIGEFDATEKKWRGSSAIIIEGGEEYTGLVRRDSVIWLLKRNLLREYRTTDKTLFFRANECLAAKYVSEANQ